MRQDLIESPCGCQLTAEQVKTLWGRYTGSLSAGRPRETDRCACGLMTQARAMARGHRCTAPGRKGKAK